MPDYEAIHFRAAWWNCPWCPHGPCGLGALGSTVSLSSLQPGILVSPPCLACHGGDGHRPATASSPLRHRQGEGLQEPGSTCQASAATPSPIVVPSWGCARSWSAVQPDGEDTAPSAPICNFQGQQEQCWAVWEDHTAPAGHKATYCHLASAAGRRRVAVAGRPRFCLQGAVIQRQQWYYSLTVICH